MGSTPRTMGGSRVEQTRLGPSFVSSSRFRSFYAIRIVAGGVKFFSPICRYAHPPLLRTGSWSTLCRWHNSLSLRLLFSDYVGGFFFFSLCRAWVSWIDYGDEYLYLLRRCTSRKLIDGFLRGLQGKLFLIVENFLTQWGCVSKLYF